MGIAHGRLIGGNNGAASKGARGKGGRTIGILPFRNFEEAKVSSYVDIAIFTGMGDARNAINVLTSQVVLVCGIGSGTASEAALAIKANRPVVLVAPDKVTEDFFQSALGGVHVVRDAASAIETVRQVLGKK